VYDRVIQSILILERQFAERRGIARQRLVDELGVEFHHRS
jgi:hypothetical protein